MRKPKRRDGIRTKEKILKAAIELFSNKNYQEVSVSMITKKANVANSSFYQYYKNKDSVFNEILDEFFAEMRKRIKGNTLEDVITSFMDFANEKIDEFKIIHEAELTHKKVRSELNSILSEKVKTFNFDKVENIFFWGPLRFSIIYFKIWHNEPLNVSELTRFIREGIDPNNHEYSEDIFDYEYFPVSLDSDSTQIKLLISAEELFGKYGYTKTQISDITKNAGVAHGTFYLYFNSKKEILKKLIERTNKNLRLTIKLAIEKFTHRLDAEIAGYYAFLKFFNYHKNMYRIVREGEFICPEASTQYYEKIQRSYINPLLKAMKENQVKKYDPSQLAVFLMGIGHYLGQELLLFENTKEENFIKYLMKISKYLSKGISGVK